jgi:indole-3-glycerol phosphate synthase/phosphoribosylanthranilate isomerase
VLAEAERLAMDTIVEVHDETELTRALAIGARIIGINNRDLKSLRTDLGVTERLAAKVPTDVLLISESGIGSRGDVERLAPVTDAYLVGSSLMAAEDIDEASRSLVHGRVKLCGLTDVQDVQIAARAGATHAGLIMVPGTPRQVSIGEAAPLAVAALDAGLKPVGVFRDAPAEEVVAAAGELGLTAVQLHGSESAATISEVQDRFAGEVWTASGPQEDRGGDRPVLDNGTGGTGKAFDWELVAAHPQRSQAFLAGGIGPDNARAAQKTGVYGIDVGSRVEAAPGRKDPAKVQALFDALRPADRRAA